MQAMKGQDNMKVDSRGAAKSFRLQTAVQGWTVGISFEPLPGIEFKVLRIRVKCQGGQQGDLFRLA